MRDAAVVAISMRRCYRLNMETQPNHNMTVDEFLPWAEARERGRYELHDGEVIAMAPERAAHWKVKFKAAMALHHAIAAAGLKCHAVPDGATVRISPSTAFGPDALVYCGEEGGRRLARSAESGDRAGGAVAGNADDRHARHFGAIAHWAA